MKNLLLRTARLQKGWSQQQLADFAGVSLSTVERAERGEPIRADTIGRLCACLQKAADQLGLLQVEGEEAHSVNRRQANQTIAGLVGGLLLPSTEQITPLWERLSRTLTKPCGIDHQALQGLEQITQSYWQLRSSLGYSSLLKGFLGHLEVVDQLLHYPNPPTVHKRLCSIASKIAQRIGASYFDMSNYALAKSYYKVSVEAAREADNYTLLAVGLGRMSSLPIYSNHPHEAIPLLQEAQQIAVPHCPPQIAAWLASVEAEAQANLSESTSCIRLLGQAEHVLAQANWANRDGDAYSREINFDYARLAGYKGACYVQLQKAHEAFSALDESIRLIDISSVRQRSILLADTAATYLQMKQIEAACRTAIQVLELNRLTKSNLVIQRIQKVRAAMQPWETTGAVKDFDAYMALHVIW